MASGWRDFYFDDPRKLKKKSSDTILISQYSIGKVRGNRPQILSEVNRRFSSFSRDYQKLLEILCNKLRIPYNAIKSMLSSEMGKSILTLFKSSCTNIDQYLPLFHSDIKYTMGSYSKLITVILDISFQVQAIINEVRAVNPLELITFLKQIVTAIENCEMQHDLHMNQILSWWFPQLLEIITVILLNTDSSSPESSQSLSDYKTISQFYEEYLLNLVVSFYLMSGAYFIHLDFTSKCKIVEQAEASIEMENDLFNSFQEKAKKLSTNIRKRLHTALKDSQANEQIKQISRTISTKNYQPNNGEIYSWKDIYSTTPMIYSSTLFLFLIYIPDDFKVNFSMDVVSSENRARHYPSYPIDHCDDPLTMVLERASKIGDSIEFLRQNWPLSFTDKSVNIIMRTVILLAAEADWLHHLNGMVPFVVPETWDNWLLFIDLIDTFLDYISCLAKRKATFEEVQSPFGKFVVQIRFLYKLERIETAENSLLYF